MSPDNPDFTWGLWLLYTELMAQNKERGLKGVGEVLLASFSNKQKKLTLPALNFIQLMTIFTIRYLKMQA